MTLKFLANNVEIQGPVRISVWDDMGEKEVEVHELSDADGLRFPLRNPELRHLSSMNVTYMFAPGDGFLHIELD